MGQGMRQSQSCAKALPGLISPLIPEVVAAWNELAREKQARGSNHGTERHPGLYSIILKFPLQCIMLIR